MMAIWWYLLLAQLALFGNVALCVGLQPRHALSTNQRGVSRYGTDRKTVIPYSLAFGLYGLLTLLAAFAAPASWQHRQLVYLLLLNLGGLFWVVLATTYPYERKLLWKRLHFGAAIVGIVYEAVMSLVLLLVIHPPLLSYAAFGLELVGDAICILALGKVFQRLFVGQLLAQAGFTLLLFTTLNALR